MLFYGPSGAGKKTRIAGTLLELFGKGAEKVSYTPLRVSEDRRRTQHVVMVDQNRPACVHNPHQAQA